MKNGTYRVYLIGCESAESKSLDRLERERLIKGCDACALQQRPLPIGSRFRSEEFVPGESSIPNGEMRVIQHELGGKIIVVKDLAS